MTLINGHYIAGVLALTAALVLAVVMASVSPVLGSTWLLATAAGFTLQRSRFCFASAFRDLYLFGSGRTMKAILLGLAVATVGFTIIMYDKIPNPSYGYLPDGAHILPFGVSTAVGGLLFGFGMVISGGCISGSLYRMAEGYLGSWVTIIGVLVGLAFLSHTWNWWWNTIIIHEPRAWLPNIGSIGYAGAVVLTLIGLFSVFLLVVWWESREGLSLPNLPSNYTEDDTVTQKLHNLWKMVFVNGWPAATGGVILGVIITFMYMDSMPLGVTGELSRLSGKVLMSIGLPHPHLLGLSDLGGCSAEESLGFFSHTFAMTGGVLAGSFVAALFAREFKFRRPPSATRYIQSFAGGTIMGYGAGLAIGCTIGAFFDSIASLSLSGWLFGIAIAGGAFFGVQAIKRIP